jgi:hypothetical protein
MTVAVLLLAGIVFIESFLFLELAIQARAIAFHVQRALRVLGDRMRSDDEKEKYMRASSRAIFTATLVLIAKIAAITAVFAVALGLVSLVRPEIAGHLIDVSSSPSVIVLLSIFALSYVWLRHALFRRV